MNGRIAAAVGLMAISIMGNSEAKAVDVTECAIMLEADEARLACYDRIVLTEMKRQLADKPGSTPAVDAVVNLGPTAPAEKPAITPAVMPFSERSFKRMDPSDIRATPAKWLNRDIEFATAQVYWVADDDLRVLTKESLTLFGRAPLGSAEDIAYLRENCETSKEASSSKCRVRVRFNYTRHSEDTPGGMYKRTVLVAPQVEFARLGRARR